MTINGDSILKDKHLILGVCGGIAAYKSVELLRLLIKSGGSVRVVMTEHARQFVGPVTFEALSGKKVWSTLFEEYGDEIRASRKRIEKSKRGYSV